MAAIQPTGSSPTPRLPSFSSTRWNNRTVDAVCFLLTAAALYVIWKLTHPSTPEAPKPKIRPEDPFLTHQHTISFDETKPCINESPPFHFEKYAEGIIHIDIPDNDPWYYSNDIRLITPGESAPFFVCTCRRSDTIFVPNLPYLKDIILSIDNKHFNLLSAYYPKALYTVSFSDSTSSTITTQEIKKTNDFGIERYLEPPPLISSAGIIVTFKADGTIDTRLEGYSFLMVNQGAECVVYLEISIPEKYRTAEDQNIVLIWVLEPNRQKDLTSFELKEAWKKAYTRAVKDVSIDDDLQLYLHAIRHRVYSDISPPPANEKV
ncbi:MAG TPA: hypothetical protein VHK67_04510 [Rhabdochlamydiaceae bacterium]|nr:hypothetical protein [Rhabdochlamydiaceae bacterium]